MRLKPRRSADFVIVCEGANVMLFDSAEWERRGIAGEPVLRLEEDEGAAVARFVTHWAESREQPPGSRRTPPDVAYDL